MDKREFDWETEILYKGDTVKGMGLTPESPAIFLTSAFDLNGDLDDVNSVYENKGYAYIRSGNPNRHMLADKISFLEGGEESAIFSSGMAAITTVLLTYLKKGDHILSSDTLYGESLEFVEMLPNFGIECSFVNFTDNGAVKAAIRPNTKMILAETVCNPTITLVDIPTIAEMAHQNGALLVIDNTFATAYAIRCLDLGADIVVNSLTKFINGHSDALLGSATGRKDLMERLLVMQSLMGSTGGSFNTWLVQRSMLTFGLRMKQQMATADILARSLSKHPHILRVNYPTVDGYAQAQLAKKLFKGGYYGAMMSIVMPDDRNKVNEFVNRLRICHYAPTLGGVRTTMSHPATSSHRHMPEGQKKALGLTVGLMRISVGLEEPEDLVADFTQALDAFGK